MLGPASLFPFLKGWEYKSHTLNRTVNKGQTVDLSVSEDGWLVGVNVLTSDAAMRVGFDFQGADMEMFTNRITMGTPIIGSVEPDPSGYMIRQIQPNPDSTAGLFVAVMWEPGFYGALIPFVATFRMSAELLATSTQNSAIVNMLAFTVAITHKQNWLQSLRACLAIKDMKIPSYLLTPGGV